MRKATITFSILCLGALAPFGVSAMVPDYLPVQGALADDAGDPVDGQIDLTFTLYDDAAGTTTLWTDTFSAVEVTEGLFTVYLGSNTALDLESLMSNAEIWVGITIGTDAEMARFQLATVPFAHEARECGAVGTLTEADINSNLLPSSYVPDWSDLQNVPTGFADGTDDGLTSETELTALLDDNYLSSSSPAGGIASSDLTNWSSVYNAGDHALAGYLTSESDPVFTASVSAGIVSEDTVHWNTMYWAWGDHSGLYAPVVHDHDSRYYTKTEMQSSGTAQVHWDNLSNVPAGFADGVDDTSNIGIEFAGGDQTLNLSYSAVTVRSVTLAVPQAGWVKVDASGQVAFTSTGEDYLRCSISSNTSIDYNYLVLVGDHHDSDTTESWDNFYSTRTFSASAGNHTYNLVCDGPRGTVQVMDSNINAVFHSNQY